MVWGKPGVSLGFTCLLAAVVGCAGTVQGAGPLSSGDALVGSDLTQFGTVYDAVAALRGNWLSGHATMACRCEPAVYVNGSKARDLNVLRSTPPMTGVLVRHLSARDAAARFGSGHEGGAILVEAIR